MSSLTRSAVLKVFGVVGVGLASFWITPKILDLQQPNSPDRLIGGRTPRGFFAQAR
jgi:hypothetical protein